MGLIEFQKLPITTLIGARWDTFNDACRGRIVDPSYRKKYYLTKAICRLLSLLQPLEDHAYRKMARQQPPMTDPLFILGHWRSGTTFVHNIFALDKHFGYNTTYQTVFPNLMLFGQPFFKSTMAWLMPDKRPTDNLELQVDLPQEEEFALANMMTEAFYHFWYFPKDTMEYMEKYLLFEQATPGQIAHFKEVFHRLVVTSLYNTQGTQFLSKNPPHTARIPQLLEMYPNAKFIYLVRNPYTVFESTRSFFTATIQPLKLQTYSNEEIERNILTIYDRMYRKYEQDKQLIPQGNLMEIRFEDFEANALDITRQAYRSLQLDGYDEARPAIEHYLDRKKGYKKNQYRYEPRTRELVEKHWGYALDQWNYSE